MTSPSSSSIHTNRTRKHTHPTRRMLLTEGFTVACFDVRAAALEEVKAALVKEEADWGGRIHPFAVDVRAWLIFGLMVDDMVGSQRSIPE